MANVNFVEEKNVGGRPIEWTPEKLKELGEELLDFSQNTVALHVSKFEIHKGHMPGWLAELASRYPSFSPYIKGARNIFGNKILEASLSDCKPHGVTMGKVMPMYLKDVKDFHLDVLDKEEAIKHKYKAKESSQADERADRIIEALERNTKKDA